MSSDDSDPSGLKQKIGRRIQTLRKLRGLTQENLAEFTDLSVEFISVLERGRSWPSIKSLQAIGQALNVPFWMLLGPAPLEPSLNQLVTLFPNIVLNEVRYNSILIVSPLWDFRESLGDFLREYTFIGNVHTAASASLGKPELIRAPHDILILDLETPDMHHSGIIEHAQAIPITILLTPSDIITGQLRGYQANGHIVMRKSEIVDYLVPLLVATAMPYPTNTDGKK